MSEDENTDDAQYGFFKTDDGDTVLYDRNNPEAWIQSTFSVAVGATAETETRA
ncbi:hypothetical protein SAMN05216559_2007 [Halomicrobium zhouii]|uniref:Uncharacterized protein n=1 Tax=Halomicrobium zhouii TaxID=767519 RepID=A0A1I6L4V8_9EURY|nr:hypothetical protein [Halomicrobium zhouii]SFR98290.1 hypothetical protein SAMN05216559_2007 [Halomicrobium zhouii]